MNDEMPGPDAPSGAERPTETTARSERGGPTGDGDDTGAVGPSSGATETDSAADAADSDAAIARKRRRGSRGGQRRRKPEAGADRPDEASAVDAATDGTEPEMPEPLRENRPSAEAAERALVRKPQIGDTRPAPAPPAAATPAPAAKRGRKTTAARGDGSAAKRAGGEEKRKRTPRGQRGRGATAQPPVDVLEQRRGRERNGRPVGR